MIVKEIILSTTERTITSVVEPGQETDQASIEAMIFEFLGFGVGEARSVLLYENGTTYSYVHDVQEQGDDFLMTTTTPDGEKSERVLNEIA